MSTAWQSWLRCPCPRPQARVLLVCCPHAGGAASFFYPWMASLHRSVELVAVQYPGREDRTHESPAEDLHELADQVAEALAPVRGYPLALFGHSMGAMVAYEVALRIERRWGIAPSRLFVSGSDAPTGRPLENSEDEPDDNELVTLLRGWGLIDPAVLAQPELRQMALSALRADLRLLGTYRATPTVGLTCPVTAVVGDDDPEVSIPQVLEWTRFTQGEFDFRVLTGDHFYLVPRQEELIMEVQYRLGVHTGVTAQWSTP